MVLWDSEGGMRGGWEERTEMKVRRSSKDGVGWTPNLMRRPVKPERNHIRLRGGGMATL